VIVLTIALQSIMFWLVFLFWEILPFPSTCLRYLLSHVEHSNGKGMYTAAWMRSGWILSGTQLSVISSYPIPKPYKEVSCFICVGDLNDAPP
jgi:hypothetical protein